MPREHVWPGKILEGNYICEISVVVPTFNRCDSLRRLLESLRRQTLSPSRFQVIVVSDGSTDDTVKMVREMKGKLSESGSSGSCQSWPGCRAKLRRGSGMRDDVWRLRMMIVLPVRIGLNSSCLHFNEQARWRCKARPPPTVRLALH